MWYNIIVMRYIKLLLLLILLIPFYPLKAQYPKGVPAGMTITNVAEVEWDGTYSATDIITTNVMAIYGMSEITGPTQGQIFPGGEVYLVNYITNNANTNLIIEITMSNFNMKAGYSGSNWRATLTNLTSQTIVGTTGGPIVTTVTLSYGEVFSFTLWVKTAPDALPDDWGELPIILNIIGTNTNSYVVKYQGDNGKWYGGVGIHTYTPRVTISGPFIALRKVLTISNLPQYLAMGGMAGIPVPDATITYTNYYDNDGNAVATNLVIIDTIPTHTDFIVGSITIIPYTNASGTTAPYIIEYADRAGVWGYTPIASGPFGEDPNVGKIRIRFTGFSVGIDNGDSYGVADGAPQDIDAGYMWYKVVVHRRNK